MTESTKIEFRYRRIREIADITDVVAVLFPGNPNQQHAAARILLVLKAAKQPVDTLNNLETRFSISRRTLQRTRAKLARLGLIEYVGWMNSRYGGRQGWKASTRFRTALRSLAERIDGWRRDVDAGRKAKDERLISVLR